MFNFKKLVSAVLVFQISLGTVILSGAYAQTNNNSNEVNEDHEFTTRSKEDIHLPTTINPEFKKVLNEFETANMDVMPPASPDIFSIKEQYLFMKGKRYHISDPNVVVDAPRADFDHVDVVGDQSNSSLNFVYAKDGKEVARHEIHGLNVVHVVQDKEMVQFITSDRKLHAIDMANVRKLIFEAPIPVYELVTLNQSIPELDKIKISLLTRGVRPPDEISKNAFLPSSVNEEENAFTAGDLMVYEDEPGTDKRILHAIYSRSVVLHQVGEQNTVLALLSSLVSPQEKIKDTYLQNSDKPGATIDPQQDIIQASSAVKNSKISSTIQSMDALSRNALVSIVSSHPTQPSSFLGNVISNQINANRGRDVFKGQEWNSYYQNLLLKLAIDPSLTVDQNNEILKNEWKVAAQHYLKETSKKNAKFNEVIDTYSLKMIAYIIGGGAAASALVVQGLEGRFGAWGVYLVSAIMKAGPFDVLRDATYRYPTLLIATSSIILLSPIMIGLGGLYGYMNKKIGALRGFATFGVRIAAFGQFPLIENLVNATRRIKKFTQKNVINKVRKIVGVPLGSIQDPLSIHEDHINKIRIKSYSWFLSHIVVAQKYGVDLTTLLMEENGIAKLSEAIQRSDLNQNTQFLKDWDLVNQDVVLSLSDIYNNNKMTDLSLIDPSDLARDQEIAENAAKKLIDLSEGQRAKNLRVLKNRFIHQSNETFNYLSTFGSGEYKLFRTVDINSNLAKDVYQQYAADYIFSGVLQSLWGERANLAVPEHLAAMEGKFLSINPGHFSDMVEQNFLYMVGLSANMVQVYQQPAMVSDSVFNPIETVSLKPAVREEPFMISLKRWGLGLADLKSSNYGGIALKTFWTRVTSMQMGFIFSFLARVFVAGKTPGDASVGYLYSLFFGFFTYRYFWVFVNRGNEVLRDGIESVKVKYDQSISKLNQGLRMNDSVLVNQGYDEVMEYYENNYRNGTNLELMKIVSKVERFMKIPLDERVNFGETLAPYFSALVELRNAHDVKDRKAEEKAYQKIRDVYLQGPDRAIVQKLTGEALRNYAVNHPPIYNKYNHFMSEFATIVAGVIPSTVCASSLFAASYDHITLWSFAMNSAITGGLFTTIYFAQKFINPYKEGWVKQVSEVMEPQIEGFKNLVKPVLNPLIDTGVKIQLGIESICNKALQFKRN